MERTSRLLVAEDSPTQAAQISFLLEEAGYAVQRARDGQEALELVRSEPPQLVLTDLDMPRMTGLELVEALRSEFPRLPVVLITAKGSEDIAAKALRRGAASYIPKRNLDLDLLDTIRQLLAIRSAEEEAEQLRDRIVVSELQFQLESDDTLVAPLIAHLQHHVARMGLFGDGELIQIATALDEALMNAIIHGNLEVSSDLREVDEGRAYIEMIRRRRGELPYRDRTVRVTSRATRTEAVFTVCDQGPGFNPHDVPDPTDPANLEKVSGRGLLLIHAFMDEVQHNERGNQITMTKRKQKGE